MSVCFVPQFWVNLIRKRIKTAMLMSLSGNIKLFCFCYPPLGEIIHGFVLKRFNWIYVEANFRKDLFLYICCVCVSKTLLVIYLDVMNYFCFLKNVDYYFKYRWTNNANNSYIFNDLNKLSFSLEFVSHFSFHESRWLLLPW